jgi:adenylate cyclase class 2
VSREREAKLPVEAADARRRLEEGEAVLLVPRHHEENWLLDSADNAILSAGCLLRVRRDAGGWLLTFKGPGEVEGGHKVREEIETRVDDGEILLRILQASGFRVIWRYEKRRTAWSMGDVRVFLDETPAGDYLELEGDEGATEEAARSLGYDPAGFVALTYAEIHGRRCEERGLPFGDMLFREEGA